MTHGAGELRPWLCDQSRRMDFMSESLIILQRHGAYSLALRTHDLSGTDYAPLVKLTRDLAHAISGPQTGIHFLHGERLEGPAPEKRELSILRRKDRKPNTRSWELMAGGERLGFITDEAVLMLQKHAKVSFEAGEPNWESRQIENIDDQLHELARKTQHLQERREALLARCSETSDDA